MAYGTEWPLGSSGDRRAGRIAGRPGGHAGASGGGAVDDIDYDAEFDRIDAENARTDESHEPAHGSIPRRNEPDEWVEIETVRAGDYG